MAGIIGIPSTRVSDQFVRQRLLQQVQFDQRELFQLQTQLSTGRQFERPGENPVSAGRIMSLQSLLERKAQVRTNLTTNQSFLSSTDVAMSRISGMVADVRGAAISVVGTAASEAQRSAAAMQVSEAIKQLLDAGNQNFRGRYLFAGSITHTRPFDMTTDGVVEYSGNETTLLSYSDVDLLFETNVNGNHVFGAISEPVRGSVDLDPVLNFDTRLADLRGGQGISLGSIAISDGSQTSIIDFSGAATIGDVAALIRNNPPEGRLLEVEVTTNGLNIRLNQDAPGDLSINEVGRGTTAGELGLLTEIGIGLGTVEGRDLDPILRTTTRLDDILGTRARAVVRTASDDNDFILEADRNGADLNGQEITFVDDPTVSFGNETIVYDPIAGTIEIHIDNGYTQAEHVVDAINAAHDAATIPFSAWLDPLDQRLNPGSGLVSATPIGQVAATTGSGSDIDFDRDSGLRIENGGKVHTIQFDGAETIEDLLNTLNGAGAGLVAQINADASGIDVRSRLSGADFSIGENGGGTATELGLRTLTATTRLDEMNHGFGVVDGGDGGARADVAFDWGANSQLLLRAKTGGSDANNFLVAFVDSGPAPGSESVAWDPVAKTITIAVRDGVTTAQEVVDLFAATPGPRDQFELLVDTFGAKANTGQGVVGLATATTDGGWSQGSDFIVTRRDGVELEIDLAGLDTMQEVLVAINTHPNNADGMITASLAAYGNGIELTDQSLGIGQLQVAQTGLSSAAVDLGLIAQGETIAVGHDTGLSATLTGHDTNPSETEGVFTALLRLQTALEDNDLPEVKRAIELLDSSAMQFNFTRAELGAKQQGLDVLADRLDAEELDLREVLSLEHDIDIVEVISQMSARQMALEASMQATARIFQMTLLDYL